MSMGPHAVCSLEDSQLSGIMQHEVPPTKSDVDQEMDTGYDEETLSRHFSVAADDTSEKQVEHMENRCMSLYAKAVT